MKKRTISYGALQPIRQLFLSNTDMAERPIPTGPGADNRCSKPTGMVFAA